MANQYSQLEFNTVELTQDINVHTSLPPSCHSALRAGFAGYTDNPRWTPRKRSAWKQGKQWRGDLAANLLQVENGLLMTPETREFSASAIAAQQALSDAPSESNGSLFHQLLSWSRKKTAAEQPASQHGLDPSIT